MSVVVISQPMLFPWVGMYEQIRLADIYVHYDDVPFSFGSFTNRVQLKTPGGNKWMTIPLQRYHLETKIAELRVDESQDWRRRHLDRLRQLYRKAKYFDDMMAVIQSVYAKQHASLVDLLVDGMHSVGEYFDLMAGKQVFRSSELGVGGRSSERVLNIVRHFGGDRYVTGHGGRNYLDHEQFEASGVAVEYLAYRRSPYPQLYGEFDPHVSILDLIANMGKSGRELISSGTIGWRELLKS